MSGALARICGVSLACASTLMWLIDLVAWQPQTELAMSLGGDAAQNNTYWTRDLRWALIVAAAAGIVWAWRGATAAFVTALFITPSWFVLDAVADRLDAGPRFGWIAGTVTVLVSVLVLVFGRSSGRRSPGLLLLAAYVAAATAPFAAQMESPSGLEMGLTIGATAAAALLTVAALGAAVTATPARGRPRLAAAAYVALASAVLIAAARLTSTGYRLLPSLALGIALLTAVHLIALTLPRTDRLRRAAHVAGAMTAAFIVVSFILSVISLKLPLAASLTKLAGNPAVNSADTDAIVTTIGMVTGLLIGGAALALRRSRVGNALAEWVDIDSG